MAHVPAKLLHISDRSAGELRADGTWGFQAGGLAAVVEPAVRALAHIVATEWMSAAPYGRAVDPSPAHRAGFAGVANGNFLQRFVSMDPGPLDRSTSKREQSSYDLQREVVLNEGLWWLLHNMTDFFPRIERDLAVRWDRHWSDYEKSTAKFGEALERLALGGVDPATGRWLDPALADDATIIVHDFHLALLGTAIPNGMKSVFVCHTPFGTPESFELLPEAYRDKFLEGLEGFDSIVFHTQTWADFFNDTMRANGRTPPRAVIIPARIDAAAVVDRAQRQDVADMMVKFRQDLADSGATPATRIIGFVARTDLKNGNLSSLESLRQWMIQHPEKADTVRMVMCCKATRDYGFYARYQAEVEGAMRALEQTAAEIATARGIPAWRPMILDSTGNRESALAAMRLSDVFWANAEAGGLEVTPAEAALLMKPGGRLMISDGAGIHGLYKSFQGRPASLIVPAVRTYPRPEDLDVVVAKLDEAVEMPPDEAMTYWSTAREIAGFNDPRGYAEALRQAVDPTLHVTPVSRSGAGLSMAR